MSYLHTHDIAHQHNVNILHVHNYIKTYTGVDIDSGRRGNKGSSFIHKTNGVNVSTDNTTETAQIVVVLPPQMILQQLVD